MTPGQIVDLIHAAILAAEQDPAFVDLEYRGRDILRASVQILGSAHAAALAVLAHLGDGDAVLQPFHGDARYGYLVRHCERVGIEVRIMARIPDAAPAVP